ncbi:tRNA dimethylallyltransferase [Treponema bryantii]|uniref:tRNA dimethylallyltransferase n=1 Tax=Treponema bryantii TaxID=163 RepID=A0A1H9IFC0_9SPIR|nr:tRNA (adenosine(37)-N6)-dimethylallyltransferase MiaA [Treponema bryantii]SEQ73085.1 tRNA dimethylallyltransferase [Treponema bryantii]
MSSSKPYNCVIILGPTAVGKTAIGVAVARAFNGEIISADSRQTYRHLDIGSGKDLADYAESKDGAAVPYHLIDITELPAEYNVYNYQQDFYKAFKDITGRGKLPVIVGGTGMYLDAIVRDYQLVILPENKKLHEELEATPLEVLAARLMELQPDLHTKGDLLEKDRVIKALEIIEAKKNGVDSTSVQRPEINPLIIGTTLPRPQMWENISIRLKERLDGGMLEEVQSIHDSGITWERLEKLGLEYRFCSQFLQGKIATKEELFEGLFIAIRQFAKRQETWFRMMEKKGVEIKWLEPGSKEERIAQTKEIIASHPELAS